MSKRKKAPTVKVRARNKKEAIRKGHEKLAADNGVFVQNIDGSVGMICPDGNKPIEGATPAWVAAMDAGDYGNAYTATRLGGIEAQERRGVEQMVKTQQLPLLHKDEQAYLETLGFKFGEPDVKGRDCTFVNCVFPEGWKIVPNKEDPRGSYLVDPQGRQRAVIFYKAAFYDMYCSIYLTRRYDFHLQYNAKTRTVTHTTAIERVAGGKEKVLHTVPYVSGASDKTITQWLDEHYPNWSDPKTYWDEVKA